MPGDAWIMLGILAAMFALLVWDRFPAWAVFMATLTVCMTVGLAPEDDLLRGFANSGVVTVAVLFVVAGGMYSTGAITLLADRVIGLPRSLGAAYSRILGPVAAGSSFLNNTPLVAMMIPVVRDLTRKTGMAGSKLFMPLSFASMLGGAATLIGTSVNLIIAGLYLSATGEQLNIFFPSLVGIPAAVVGIVFLMTIGPRLLPTAGADGDSRAQHRHRAKFVVVSGSSLEGRTLEEMGLLESTGYRLEILSDDEGRALEIDGSQVLRGGYGLEFDVEVDAVPQLWQTIGLEPVIGSMMQDGSRYTHQLVHVVVAEAANGVGRRLAELPSSDSSFDYLVVGVSRQGQSPDEPFDEVVLEAGDTGFIEVGDEFFFENRYEDQFTLVKRLGDRHIQRTDRARIATVVTGGMVLLAAFGVMSMLNAALLAASLMVLTGCISLRRAFGSIEWDTLVVLGAAVGLEAAVTGSGLSAEIADALSLIGEGGAFLALAAVFVGAVLMTNVITNAAAAAFMFPVALALSQQLGLPAEPFIVLLMLGCSYAFVNPAAYQTNLMVQRPGNYSFADFARVGLPLTLLVGGVALVLSFVIYV